MKMGEQKKAGNKKRFWKLGLVFLAVFFVFSAFFIVPSNAKAAGELLGPLAPVYNITNSLVSAAKGEGGGWSWDPFKWLLYGLFQVMVWLLGVSATIFGWVVDPKNVSFIMNNEGLYASWAMVRDFLNLGFILVLLYIAFCVIFQIGSYSDSWKKMLLMMVIMALLVNFSFPICRFIIDISNITFYYILNTAFPGADGSSIFTKFAGDSGFAKILTASRSDDYAYLIAVNIFAFILAITFMVIAILFVVRMVAIGMLIIFSPIGIAGAAFPFSKKYATEWWDSLFKYAFFAPIMMFMIVIALNIMNFASKANGGGTSVGIMDSEAMKNLGAGQDPGFLGTMAFFSIPIVILWFGMGMAQKMSIAGASAVTGGAEKFAKAIPKFLGSAAWAKSQRIMEDKTGFSPRSFVKAWKARSEDVNRKSEEVAVGKTWDRLNRAMSWKFREKTRHGEEARQRQILKEQKEISEVNQESGYLVEELKDAKAAGDTNKAVAIMRILFNNNDQNEFMKHFPGTGGVVNPEKMKHEIDKLFTSMGMSDEESARQLSDLGEIAVGKGNYANFGMAEFKDGRYQKTSAGDQVNNAFAKAINIKAQAKADNWHWNSFFNEDKGGNAAGLHEFGEKQLDRLTASEINALPRARADFFDKMQSGIPALETHLKNYKGSAEQKALINDFVTLIKTKGKPIKNVGEVEKTKEEVKYDSAKEKAKKDLDDLFKK